MLPFQTRVSVVAGAETGDVVLVVGGVAFRKLGRSNGVFLPFRDQIRRVECLL